MLTNFNFLTNELKHVEILNLLNHPFDNKGAIITISAGNSDIDSQVWVDMLLRMYSYWCESHDCKLRFVDESLGDSGGFEYIVVEIDRKYAYGYLKSEQGIHQLRQISPFSKNSAIQTSFAKVEVIPIVDESMDFEIPMKDLEVISEVCPYGRYFWATMSHIPTGISFTSRNQRSQLQNKEKALTIVKSKLFASLQAQGVALRDIKKPSPKTLANNPIRQYIFHPYQKVKDLRTDVETVAISEVMKGNLDMFIKAYLKQAF